MNIDLIYTNIIDRNSFRLSSRDLVRKNEEAIRKEFSVGSLHFNRRLQVAHNAAISLVVHPQQEQLLELYHPARPLRRASRSRDALPLDGWPLSTRGPGREAGRARL